MNLNFLIKKWKEFSNSPEFEECKKYAKIRNEYVPTTNAKINKFIQSKMNLDVLKNVIDNIKPPDENIRRRKIMSVWGADGFKGMMLFNILKKYAIEDELKKLGKLLRKCIIIPNNIDGAEEKIDIFAEYVKDLLKIIDSKRVFEIDPQKSLEHVKIALNPSYSKTFIPVFWDMQDLDKFPIYYTSCEKVIKKLYEKNNYYSRFNSPGENYRLFYEFNLDLIKLLRKEYKENLNFSDISTNYLKYIYEVYLKKGKLIKQ